MKPKIRFASYVLIAGLLVTLAGRGLITNEEAKLWTDVLSQLLGAGGLLLAAVNVPEVTSPARGKHSKNDDL